VKNHQWMKQNNMMPPNIKVKSWATKINVDKNQWSWSLPNNNLNNNSLNSVFMIFFSYNIITTQLIWSWHLWDYFSKLMLVNDFSCYVDLSVLIDNVKIKVFHDIIPCRSKFLLLPIWQIYQMPIVVMKNQLLISNFLESF